MKWKGREVDKEVESGERVREREEGGGFWKYSHITERFDTKNDLIFSLPVGYLAQRAKKMK